MIADFGLASSYGVDSPVGDPRYMDPQVMCFQKPPSFASDVWSLGVTLFEITSGKLPFLNKKNVKGWEGFSDPKHNNMDSLAKIWCRIEECDLKEPDCTKIPNLLARSLAKALLQVDVSKRESLDFALAHPFTHLGDVLHLRAEDGSIEDHNIAVLAHVAHGKEFKLREVLLELVESRLQGEELDYYTELFDEVDTDNDGKLSRQEFKAWWDSVPGIGKPSVDEVLPNVDLDDDGFIEFNEFTALNFDARLLGKNTEKILHSAFDAIAGKDGQIHVEDMQNLVSKGARPFVKHLIDEMDVDGDNKVCYKEFTSYLLELGKPDSQEAAAELPVP
jgi:serine/threonine protein kinase